MTGRTLATWPIHTDYRKTSLELVHRPSIAAYCDPALSCRPSSRTNERRPTVSNASQNLWKARARCLIRP